MIISIIIIAAVVLADQLTKQLVVHFLDRSEPFDVISGIFRFTYVENRGAAFGMLDDKRWIFMVVSSIAIVALLVYMSKFAPPSKMLKIGLSFIVGGGIGNMIDRVAYGYVVDFLDFCAFPNLWKWMFNVADACVCVGAAMVAVYLIADIIKESKKERAALLQKSEEIKED